MAITMKLARSSLQLISALLVLVGAVPAFAEAQAPGVLELKRFVVPGMSHDDTEELVYSFTALLLFDPGAKAGAESYVPKYRDIIIATTVGYRTFTQKNAHPFEPGELQALIERRINMEPGVPVPSSVILQSFIAKALQPRN